MAYISTCIPVMRYDKRIPWRGRWPSPDSGQTLAILSHAAELDVQQVAGFAERIRELFPRCPEDAARRIGEHACERSSGRVGRSAAGRELDDQAVRLVAIAHVRHTRTSYHSLLARGYDRHEARAQIADEVDRVLAEWQSYAGPG